jgi:hypothetical protein
MWCVGSNLFSTCKQQTEDEQRREYRAQRLDTYKEVEPSCSGRRWDNTLSVAMASPRCSGPAALRERAQLP